MANKKSNILSYATIGVILIIILAILFYEDILDVFVDNQSQQVVDILPSKDNAVNRLIEEAEERGKERRYTEAIAKLEEAQAHKDPGPTEEQKNKISSLITLFNNELQALNAEKEKLIIDERIAEGRRLGQANRYQEAVGHLSQTKEYTNPEPTESQHKIIDGLLNDYREKIASKPAPKIVKRAKRAKRVRKKIVREIRPRKKVAVKEAKKLDNKTLAERYYNAGKKALSRGRLAKSIELFTKALQYDNDHVLSYSYKGSAHYQNKQLKQALDSVNEALSRDPNEPNAHFVKGNILYSEKKDKEAKAEFLQAENNGANSAMLYYRLGVTYLTTDEDSNEAINYFDKALAIEGGLNSIYTRNAHYNKGIAKERIEALNEAQNDYELSSSLDKQYVKAPVQVIEILYKKGLFTDSIDKINNLNLSLKKKEAYTKELLEGTNYEMLLESAGNDAQLETKAVTAYRKALNVNPEGYEALYNLGRIEYLNKDYTKALQSFIEADRINNNDYQINYALALTQYNLNNLEESYKYFTKAAELNPNSPQAFLGLTAIDLKRGSNTNEALSNLEQANELDPENPISNNMLGILYFNTGRQEQSQEYFRKALEGDSENLSIKRNLANSLFYNRNYGEALPLYEDIVNQDQEDGESMLRLAECQIKTDNREGAKATLTALIEKFPQYNDSETVKLYLNSLELQR